MLVSDAAPGSLGTPWPGQIPNSGHVMVQRATSSSSSTAAPTTRSHDNLGQIVVTSTKMTTLPPAVCGFVPFWNYTSSVIGKEDFRMEWQVKLMDLSEIVGCYGVNKTITGVSTLLYDGSQTCMSTSGQFFCSGTSIHSIVTGCIDVSLGNTLTFIQPSFLTSYHDYLVTFGSVYHLLYIDRKDVLDIGNRQCRGLPTLPHDYNLNLYLNS